MTHKTPRIAYCVIPEIGGLFRFYKNLRQALNPFGWETLAVSISQYAAQRWDNAFADKGCRLVAEQQTDPLITAQLFAQWLQDNGINILIPMDNSVASSVIPHLPSSIRVITRCSSSTLFAYQISAIHLERLSRVIVTTPAQEKGVRRYTRASDQIELIPHGVKLCNQKRVTQHKGNSLQLVYIGRLDDSTKGILWLPDIIGELTRAKINFTFHIVGDGPDKAKLQRNLQKAGHDEHCVKLLGALAENVLFDMLPSYDILLMPSRFEGFGFVLTESMAAGVVPVASHIKGVTDFIVENGKSGFLCQIGNVAQFAEAIKKLNGNPLLLAAMSESAIVRVETAFSLEKMGERYHRVFSQVLEEKPLNVSPKPWSEFQIHPLFRPKLRKFIPQWLKNFIRRYAQV